MNDRIEALKALLSLDRSVEEILGYLSKFEWNSDELVVLEINHLKSLLSHN